MEAEYSLQQAAQLLRTNTAVIATMQPKGLFPRCRGGMIPSGDLGPFMKMTREEIEELV